MSTARSTLQMKRAAVEKRNTTVTLIVLAVWLGLSFLGQMLFMDQNERLDAGAIFAAGAGPVLLVSALLLILRGTASRGVLVRAVLGIVCAGAAVGELTDIGKAVIWGSAGGAVLAVGIAAILLVVVRRR